MPNQQQTLTGEKTDQERRRPATMLYCDKCDAPVLRSKRFEHEHDLDPTKSYEQAITEQVAEQVANDANILTQTYRVTYHYEYVEQVTVEAACKAEAKEEADEVRSLKGEYVDTIHTEREAIGEESVASIEYLERYNLLPDDHDLTQEDIERVIHA